MLVSELNLGSKLAHCPVVGGEYWSTELTALALSVTNSAFFAFGHPMNEFVVAALPYVRVHLGGHHSLVAS